MNLTKGLKPQLEKKHFDVGYPVVNTYLKGVEAAFAIFSKSSILGNIMVFGFSSS